MSRCVSRPDRESIPSTPSWFGEVALIIPYRRRARRPFCHQRGLVRLARRRFGHYEVIDFLAVLFGYEILGERTLEAFYERLLPLAHPFMALFDRERLPSRSALSRFLASLSLRGHRSLAHPLSRRSARAPVFPKSDTQASLQIEQATHAWSLTSMGRGKPPGNGRGLRQRSCLHHSVA